MQAEDTSPILSDYRDDPDMDELIGEFVAGLSARVDSLRSLLERGDLAGVKTLAHQLKGASGGYGFDVIGQAAGRLEAACKASNELNGVQAEVQELIDLCRRARWVPASPSADSSGSSSGS